MTNISFALRPEARPVPYHSLNRSQHATLKNIVAAMAEAVQDAKSSQDGDSAIDTNRASRLYFVSGEPGSGKSSLYTTLRYITDRSTDAKERPDPEYSTYISELEQIRWLDPLDLEVAVDEEENLLAAVLVRIFAAIDDAIDEPGNYSPLSASKDCRDAMAQLEELANDIGIAWEGNLKARAGALDPDSYSQETIRAQRTRLKTNRRLRLALNALFRGKGCYGLSGKH